MQYLKLNRPISQLRQHGRPCRWAEISLRHPLELKISPSGLLADAFFLRTVSRRTSWLFTGSEQAGKRAAAIQTLLGTAKLNGLDPAAWLRDTLEKLPTCLNSQIDSLLPLRSEPLLQTTS